MPAVTAWCAPFLCQWLVLSGLTSFTLLPKYPENFRQSTSLLFLRAPMAITTEEKTPKNDTEGRSD